MSNKKVVLITGSSSGIGAASALLFAERGWNVCINYSRDPKPADEVAVACRAKGAEVLVEQADVSDDAQCVRTAERIKTAFGRCDALVNNAGTTKFMDIRKLNGLSAEDFHKIYDVNVIGAFQMTRAVTPLLRAQPGAGIVNVSSIAAISGIGSSIAYMASKGALNGMTVALARALAPDIRVNAVLPGMVDTRWLRSGLGDRYQAIQANYESASLLNAVVMPEDVAAAIYYFAAEAKKTTGQFQLIDGGRLHGR